MPRILSFNDVNAELDSLGRRLSRVEMPAQGWRSLYIDAVTAATALAMGGSGGPGSGTQVGTVKSGGGTNTLVLSRPQPLFFAYAVSARAYNAATDFISVELDLVRGGASIASIGAAGRFDTRNPGYTQVGYTGLYQTAPFDAGTYTVTINAFGAAGLLLDVDRGEVEILFLGN